MRSTNQVEHVDYFRARNIQHEYRYIVNGAPVAAHGCNSR